jgi:hypothetical protein
VVCPLEENTLWKKTPSGGKHPLEENTLWRKTTFWGGTAMVKILLFSSFCFVLVLAGLALPLNAQSPPPPGGGTGSGGPAKTIAPEFVDVSEVSDVKGECKMKYNIKNPSNCTFQQMKMNICIVNPFEEIETIFYIQSGSYIPPAAAPNPPTNNAGNINNALAGKTVKVTIYGRWDGKNGPDDFGFISKDKTFTVKAN